MVEWPDPFLRFLGVPGSADPRALLGLGPGDVDAAQVEAALRQRIAMTFDHPHGRGAEAESVRRGLRAAAAGLLRRPAPRRHAAAPPPKLTEFDRHVLAVLIACGGWNAQTRGRLVGLANAYGVGVGGLIKVVTGLSEYAKSGGPRLGVAEITAGARRLPPAPSDEAGDGYEWVTGWAPELRDGSAASTFKLSLLFGLLTILVAVVAGRVLLAPRPRAVPVEPPAPAAALATAPAGGAEQAAAAAAPAPLRPARFPQRPAFLGQAVTAEVTAAADECDGLAEEFATLARRITVSDAVSEAVYRAWADMVRTVGAGWALVDTGTLDDIDRAMFEVLYAAPDKPSVTDRLLAALQPPSIPAAQPRDVWQGAWMAGRLAEIARSPGLPPGVTEEARSQLARALGGPPPGPLDFAGGATAWLDRAAAAMVQFIDFDPQVYDTWEFWIAAERRLGGGERHARAVMQAIDGLLAASIDLSRPGPGVNVLARLLELADFQSSPAVKERFAALVADQQRISSPDLWVMTSLLSVYRIAPWYGEDLIVPPDADWMFRRRLNDRAAAQWPAAASDGLPSEARVRGITVNAQLAARWQAQLDRQDAAPIASTDVGRLDQLVAACWLNEVALRLATGDGETAAGHLEKLENDQVPGEPGAADARGAPAPAAQRPGAPIGADGQWAVRYEQAGRSVEDRLNLLQSLRNTAGTDLGPIDAAAFAGVVYRSTPPEVRMLAQDILAEQFATGPNVALEVLEQFSGVPATEATSEIIRRLTGAMLPGARSESWWVEARLALVLHNLALRQSPDAQIDRRMDRVLDALNSRLACLGANPGTGPAPVAEALVEAWWDRAAAGGHLSDPGEAAVPGDAAEIERRRATRQRLAEGPLQRFVGAQLTVLDLMAFVAVARQPLLARQVEALLAESARRRGEAAHVLEQAVEAERAMGRLWRIQMEESSQLSAVSYQRSAFSFQLSADSRRPTAILTAVVAGAVGLQASAQDPAAVWGSRLEALGPDDPMAYFELAEEVADGSADQAQRRLARHLFALAGVLEPRLGRSACLALADLETGVLAKRRLLALAQLLDDRPGSAAGEPAGGWTDFDRASVLAVGEAISHYRTGNGARALADLRTPGATELLAQYEGVLRAGVTRFMEDCKLYNNGKRPQVSQADLVRLLRFEAALLAGGNRSWSGDLLMTRGVPLVEVDPARLDAALGADASQPCWRDGTWKGC